MLVAEVLLLVAIFLVCSEHAALVFLTLLVKDFTLHLVVMFAKSVIIVEKALHTVKYFVFVYFEEPVHRHQLSKGVLTQIVIEYVVHQCAKLLALLFIELRNVLKKNLRH